jgi:hypothetical protein
MVEARGRASGFGAELVSQKVLINVLRERVKRQDNRKAMGTGMAGEHPKCRANWASPWWVALVLLTALTPVLHTRAADCVGSPLGLAGWWPASGTANDIVGANHGALQGGATANAVGIVGSAFSFDGTNSYIQIPDAPTQKPTTLTIECWVRFASLDSAGSGGAPAGDQYLVFKQNTRSGDFEGYDLSKTRLGGGDRFRFLIASATGQPMQIEGTTLVTTGVWYHVAAVRGSNFMQLYVNGQLERQTNVTFAQDYGTLPLYFGSSGQSFWDRKLKGLLDEVSLYARALSSSEVAAIYAAGASGKCKEPGIVAHPQSQTVIAGANVSFTVAATGYGTLNYRWRLNGTTIPGATSSTLALSNVQPTNAGSYTVVVTNTLGSTTSSVAVLTVLVPPIITAQPQSRTNFVDTDASFSVAAGGMAPLSYQWLFNGTSLDGATTASLTLIGVQAADAGSYSVVVTNIAGALTSAVAVLTVWEPPVIMAQPDSRTNLVGTYASFSLTASGTQPLAYQWRFNGSDLAGATGPLFTVGAVQPSSAGSYDVVVANIAGTVTSEVATLTVWLPPTISLQPQSRTNLVGTDASFSVTANGTQPLGYQWRFNGASLAEATSANLTLTAVQASAAGSYTVVVTNIAGALTSAVAILTVRAPPVITAQPHSRTNLVGTDATFSLTATGTQLLSYQWRFNGTSLAGATGPVLTVGSVQPSSAGSYDVVVTNLIGTVTSTVATLTVWLPPTINVQPQSRTNLAGTDAIFAVAAGGTQPLSYQWRFNGAKLAGETSVNLFIQDVEASQAGSYSVLVTNAGGAATSAVAVLTVWSPPTIILEPQSRTNLVGTDASFGVGANGTQPLDFQWRFNGINLVGATSPSLTVSGAPPSSAGTYDVVVTNLVGVATSAIATLTVWVPPALSQQPQSRTNLAGTDARFSVAADGTQPLSYQWRFNRTTIAGATGASLTLNAVQTNHAGSYDVVVTNVARALTSDVATLTVWLPPTLSSQPQSRTNLAGTDATFSVVAWGAPSLSYQWRFNGTNLGGASAASLTLNGVQPSHAGQYDVVLTNLAGTLTSAVATLTVWVPPTISEQPQSRTNLAGTDALFGVAASGTQPLSYQWRVNGATIGGATTASLILSGVQTNHGGDYDVAVANLASAVTSAVATLTVWMPPTIRGQPQSRTNLAGTDAAFSVAADGAPALSYQWRFNGTNLSGATASGLTLGGVQTRHAGSYDVLLTNLAGTATSAAATLAVYVPPIITLQPQGRTNVTGTDASFSVGASGTQPLRYQWRFNGIALNDATSADLTVGAVQARHAGDYDVVVTNVATAVTSAVARLTVNMRASSPVQIGAVVLVNSQSAKYPDFQHFIQPYLGNFGVPYVVQDIATNPPSQDITNYAVIIIGHSQLDTNLTYLTPPAQSNLSWAVFNGAGLVNFDANLYNGSTGRYQFVQDIFGFTYGSNAVASGVSLPPTEPSLQMHYITARHPTNDSIVFRSNITMDGIIPPTGVKSLALAGGKPLVAVTQYGEGRALQWGSYGWMVSTVQGPVDGLDDLVWRGIVWAARKPFVMRGMPNLVTMRIDDVSGPLWWVHIANEVGLKPFLALFMNEVSEATASDLLGMVTNGNATASIHAFTASTFFYFDNQHNTNYSDLVQSNNFYLGTQWHQSHGIPISKVCATHYSDIGPNAFGGLNNWGMEFVPIEVTPGTREYTLPYAPWLVGGPYRLYETPQIGRIAWPTYYADWLAVPGHPEFNGRFFNVYSEVRDAGSCNEWCPSNNDIPGSINRGTQILKRALDSMVMATLFSHEWYIHPTPCCSSTTFTTNSWRTVLQAITNNLAAYDPIYVTLDYASQYVRATRTSQLVAADYDPPSGMVRATFSGQTDTETTLYTYVGQGNSISNITGTLPVFSGTITSTVAMLPAKLSPPAILLQPANQTALAGATVNFSTEAIGTAPFSYQWQYNSSSLIGATSAHLTLSAVEPANAGSYTCRVGNAAGTNSTSAATLTVVMAPLLLDPHATPDGAFAFTVVGDAGFNYVIDVATNFEQWSPLGMLTNFLGQAEFIDSTTSNNLSRFYRARLSN